METVTRLRELKVLPVASVASVDEALHMCEALLAADVPVVEITFRTMVAEMAIRAVTQRFPDMLVGAGTLLTPAELSRAAHAGARFVASLGCHHRLVQAARQAGVDYYPGIATPNELEVALEYGVKIVKFFPAEALGGITMLTALTSAYAHTGIRFIPTGGLSADKVKRYIQLDTVLAVGGSWMVSSRYLRAGDWESVTELAREAVYLTTH